MASFIIRMKLTVLLNFDLLYEANIFASLQHKEMDDLLLINLFKIKCVLSTIYYSAPDTNLDAIPFIILLQTLIWLSSICNSAPIRILLYIFWLHFAFVKSQINLKITIWFRVSSYLFVAWKTHVLFSVEDIRSGTERACSPSVK